MINPRLREPVGWTEEQISERLRDGGPILEFSGIADGDDWLPQNLQQAYNGTIKKLKVISFITILN
jgi:hypothetical protein